MGQSHSIHLVSLAASSGSARFCFRWGATFHPPPRNSDDFPDIGEPPFIRLHEAGEMLGSRAGRPGAMIGSNIATRRGRSC